MEKKIEANEKKRQVQKAVSFFEGLDEGGNEEGLEFVQLVDPGCIPLSVFLLILTSKGTMMLQAVLWSLDIPCWPKEAQGTTAVSKGRVCCLNWNKRLRIILLSLWSAIVSMPLQFWATAFHTLESHNIIYYPWLGSNLLLFWRFFPFTVLSFLSQGIEESEFLLLIFAILPAKFNLMCVWVKDRLVVTL